MQYKLLAEFTIDSLRCENVCIVLHLWYYLLFVFDTSISYVIERVPTVADELYMMSSFEVL